MRYIVWTSATLTRVWYGKSCAPTIHENCVIDEGWVYEKVVDNQPTVWPAPPRGRDKSGTLSGGQVSYAPLQQLFHTPTRDHLIVNQDYWLYNSLLCLN